MPNRRPTGDTAAIVARLHPALAACIFLLLVMASPVTAQEYGLPLRGVVSAWPKFGLNARVGPPKVTPFSYEVAEKAGTVGNGSEFVATDAFRSLNGEIWYRVTFTRLSNARGVNTNTQYWIVGKLRSTWAVHVLQAELPPAQVPKVGVRTGGAWALPEGLMSLTLNGFLLLVGTVLGVVIIRMESAQELDPRKWYHPFMLWQSGLLCAANLLVMLLLLSEFVGEQASGIFRMLGVLYVAPGGALLLGVVLSTLFLSFVSFAKR